MFLVVCSDSVVEGDDDCPDGPSVDLSLRVKKDSRREDPRSSGSHLLYRPYPVKEHVQERVLDAMVLSE